MKQKVEFDIDVPDGKKAVWKDGKVIFEDIKPILPKTAEIYSDAKVTTISDYIVFKNWLSSYRYFTWTRSNNMWLVGCFYGTGKQLIEKAYNDSELSGREYERIVKYVESITNEKEI